MGVRHDEFEKWTPIEGVDDVYDIDDITIDVHGITFVLIPDNLEHNKRSPHRVKLTWNDILCYQISQETYRNDYWISQSEEAWTFYVSRETRYLHDHKERSILFPENAIHFAIIGTNWIADILATEYPTVVFE